MEEGNDPADVLEVALERPAAEKGELWTESRSVDDWEL